VSVYCPVNDILQGRHGNNIYRLNLCLNCLPRYDRWNAGDILFSCWLSKHKNLEHLDKQRHRSIVHFSTLYMGPFKGYHLPICSDVTTVDIGLSQMMLQPHEVKYFLLHGSIFGQVPLLKPGNGQNPPVQNPESSLLNAISRTNAPYYDRTLLSITLIGVPTS